MRTCLVFFLYKSLCSSSGGLGTYKKKLSCWLCLCRPWTLVVIFYSDPDLTHLHTYIKNEKFNPKHPLSSIIPLVRKNTFPTIWNKTITFCGKFCGSNVYKASTECVFHYESLNVFVDVFIETFSIWATLWTFIANERNELKFDHTFLVRLNFR